MVIFSLNLKTSGKNWVAPKLLLLKACQERDKDSQREEAVIWSQDPDVSVRCPDTGKGWGGRTAQALEAQWQIHSHPHIMEATLLCAAITAVTQLRRGFLHLQLYTSLKEHKIKASFFLFSFKLKTGVVRGCFSFKANTLHKPLIERRHCYSNTNEGHTHQIWTDPKWTALHETQSRQLQYGLMRQNRLKNVLPGRGTRTDCYRDCYWRKLMEIT